MAEQARVTSIDALEAFRASLIIFMNRAHRSVDEVGDEVRQTRGWIQNDQRLHWEHELRRHRRLLGLAEAELMSAKLSNLRENTRAQENAVRTARAAVKHTEEKLLAVKRWNRDYDHKMDPLARKLQTLRDYLVHEMPRAISYLLQAQRTLEAYAEIGKPAAAAGKQGNPPLEEESAG